MAFVPFFYQFSIHTPCKMAFWAFYATEYQHRMKTQSHKPIYTLLTSSVLNIFFVYPIFKCFSREKFRFDEAI